MRALSRYCYGAQIHASHLPAGPSFLRKGANTPSSNHIQQSISSMLKSIQSHSSMNTLGDFQDERITGSIPHSRSTPLSNKLQIVLSTSYADNEIRDALGTLDRRSIKNTPEIRRELRLNIQKEVIDCNGSIVDDFGQVSEVRLQYGAIDCPS